MAINPEAQYPGRIAPSTLEYPYGAARNITLPGDGTGTPWEAALVNDLFGFQQAVLSTAGDVPSGDPDNAAASQYLNSLAKIFGKTSGVGFLAVADMVAANPVPLGGTTTELTSGMLLFTTGYAVKGDKGGAVYLVKTPAEAAAASDTIDEKGSFTLGNGNVAVLQWVDGLNVRQFGAKADYDPGTNTGTDDTDAFNAALQFLPKTSPSGLSGWGIGKIRVPKGRYLINGTITRGVSDIGTVWEGEGEQATAIHTNIDSGTMFAFNTLIQVSFKHMSFIHVPVDSRAGWTNTLFSYNGSGGGRNFALEHVYTQGFDTIIKHENTVNEDTTKVDHCTFRDCTVFLDSENPQAVVNTYSNCTWAGDIEKVFWVAGQQQTVVSSGNVVQNGTFIVYKDISGRYTQTGFTLINVKFEWATINTSPGSPPKIIESDGQFIVANVRLIDCAVRGGPTPDADARWAKFGSGQVHVTVEGGEYEGLIELVRRANYFNERGCFIQIKDAQIGKTPDQWTLTDPGGAGLVYPNVHLDNCRIAGFTPITLSVAFGGSAALKLPRSVVAVTSPGSAETSFFGGSVASVDYPVFGQPVRVESVRFMALATTDMSNKTLNVYTDAAKTQLLATLSPADVSVTNKSYDIPITGDRDTSEGIYCEVDNPATTVKGYFVVEFTSM